MDDASRGVKGGDSADAEWAPTTGADPGQPATTDETARRTAEIRSEIAQTREQMSETIEALQDRLTPAHLVAQAGDSVKEAASRKVQQMANTAEDMAAQVLDNSFVQAVRTNPIPAVMIGIGAAWLLMKRRSGSDRSSGSSDREGQGRDWRRYGAQNTGRTYGSAATSGGFGSASAEAVGTSGSSEYATARGGDYTRGAENSGGTRGAYREQGGGVSGGYASYKRPGLSFESVIRDNPLALGAAAVLVGAAIGMSIPSTEAENELMGETRDSVVGKARDLASDAADKVSEVAGQVQNAASNPAPTSGGNAGSTGANFASTGSTGSVGGTADISGSSWDTPGGSSSSGTDTTTRKRTTGSTGL